ncbi:MAG: Rieske (2Fe-2S) protein [Elusimicrobiales bacterium]|nr:Rieske (2Fe-2S) protein [Elusimicrobiales bacterium]
MVQDWLEIASLAALADGRPRAFFPKGLPVLLIRRGGELFALENRCAHMGCPLTSGSLEGYSLRCPCHDWTFDIRDGRLLAAGEIALKKYPVELRGEKVFLGIS